MNIGFDVDGVLADFSTAYQNLLIEVSGRNLFLPGDAKDAPCWDWDKLRGYTSEERRATWDRIKTEPEFTLNMSELDNLSTLRMLIKDLERRHSVYYITSRVGDRVKRYTEIWLMERLAYPLRCVGVMPTVLIAGHRSKGLFAKGLRLDAYIDDNYENVHDVAEMSPGTRVYLRTRRYNLDRMVEQPGEIPERYLVPYAPVSDLVTRVSTLGEMIDHELTNL